MLLVSGMVVSVALATKVKQVYRSQTVILYRQMARQGYGETDSARRVGSRLGDLLLAHERLLRVATDLRPYPAIANPAWAVDELRRNIKFVARDGSTFAISFDGESPALVQAVTARLAESLIQDSTRLRAEEAEELQRFLAAERDRLQGELRTREAAIGEFLLTRDLGSGAGSGAANTPPGRQGRLRPTSAPDRRDHRAATASATAATPRPAAAPRPDPELVAAERRAEAELARASADFAQAQQRLTDAHPDFIVARDRVKIAEAGLRRARAEWDDARAAAESHATAQSVVAPSPASEAARETAALERQLAASERRRARATGTLPMNKPPSPRDRLRSELELGSLRHDLEEARKRLSGLNDRQFHAALLANLEASGRIGQLVVIDPAYLPSLPLVDNKRKAVLLGGVLSLLLALSITLLRTHVDDRIFDVRDLDALHLVPRPASPHAPARHTPLAVLAIIPPRPAPPRNALSARRVLAKRIETKSDLLLPPDHPGAAAFSGLWRRMLSAGSGNPSVILVTSPGHGEGKTLVGANLALALAERHQRATLLVEGNPARPALARMFRVADDEYDCLLDQIERHRRQPQAAWRPVAVGGHSLHVMPMRSSPSARPFDAPALRGAIAALRRDYERIVIDGAPASAIPDLTLFEGAVDATILVVRAGTTRAGALVQALDLVAPATVAGVVLVT